MKEVLKINVEKPQYVAITGITYAQVDSWYGHCRRDLKLDLIYPEDFSGKTYPCVVWIKWSTVYSSVQRVPSYNYGVENNSIHR